MLLFRPKPYSDECPVSYLIRVAEGNGFNNFGHLLHHSKVAINSMESVGQHILTGHVELSGLFSSLKLDYKVCRSTEIYRNFREGIDSSFVFVAHPRVCPQCINDHGYCKSIWSFYPVIACNQHKTLLADTVAPHTKRLSWQRAGLNPFHRISFQPHKASKEALDFNQYISSLILNKVQVDTLPNILEHLGFREALTLIHLLAHFQARLNNNYFKPRNMDVQTLVSRYLDVWKAIHDWPDSFYRLMDNYVGHADDMVLARHFRSILDHLEHHQQNQGIARIKDEFLRYIEVYRRELKSHFDAEPTV